MRFIMCVVAPRASVALIAPTPFRFSIILGCDAFECHVSIYVPPPFLVQSNYVNVGVEAKGFLGSAAPRPSITHSLPLSRTQFPFIFNRW